LESLRGVFSAVSIGSAGGGCIVSDPLGIGVVYAAETPDFTAFSNRAPVAARVITQPDHDPARDPIGVGWLMHCGYIIGDATGFEGVRAIPAGGWVELHQARGASIREGSDAPWRFGEADRAADVDQLVEQLQEDIGSALRAMVDLPAPHHQADITGGKDSRLILALLMGEGLADRLQYQTFGAPSLPDVVIGTDVANRFGLKHQAVTPGPLSGGDFEEQLRIHVFRTAGMLGAWDLKRPMPSIRRVNISGGCGEILRTNYPGYRHDITSDEEMLRAFQAGMPFDPLGLIKPDLRAHYDQQAADSLLAGGTDSSEPLDLIDVFYLRNRLRRWLGTDQETDCLNRFFPLYSLVGVRAAFAIGARQRHNDFIPFEVIRRCSPELAKIPLAGGPWADDLVRHLPDAEEFQAAVPPPPPTEPEERQRALRRQWQAWRLEENAGVFRKFLATDRENPVFEVIERDAAVAAVDNARELTYMQRVELYAAVTAAIWLGQEESSWRDPVGSVAG
jgi:hypothetical protein